MENVTVDTSDLEAMARRLRDAIPAIAGDAGRDTAADVAQRTRAAMPVRTGVLAASVRAERVGDEGRLTIGAPYAGWVIYGGTRGRPYVADGRYLGPALVGADRAMAERCERETEQKARRL